MVYRIDRRRYGGQMIATSREVVRYRRKIMLSSYVQDEVHPDYDMINEVAVEQPIS